MGIYIPNMSKPKSCYNHCDFIAMEEVGCPLKDYAESHQYKDKIHPNCPLIEIVQCKDCKHFYYDKPYIIQGIPVFGHEVCDFWGDGCKTNPNGSCSYGERRSDENSDMDNSDNRTD